MEEEYEEPIIIEARSEPPRFDMLPLVRRRLLSCFEPGLIGYREVYGNVCTHFSLKKALAKRMLFLLSQRYPDQFKVQNHGILLYDKVENNE